jgi:putative ABC transport system permease protein
MESLQIALRNIRRNEKRSRLTIVTIVIGVTILMNVQGMLRGITSSVYGHMMSMDTAQVQVENAAYRAEARRLPLDLSVADPDSLAATLRGVSGVAAVSERIDAAFEITNGVEGTPVIGRGVSPEEAVVTDLGAKIVAGNFPEAGKPGLLIGKGLASKLDLGVGDSAFYTALDRHSARNLGSAPIVGVFEFGYPFLDDYLVLLDIAQARAFLDVGDVATRLVVRGTDPNDSAALAARIAKAVEKARPALTAAAGSALVTHEWKTFAENLVSTIETRLLLLGTILAVLFALIIAGIFNTMAMNVQERYREIGTLRAIGMRRSGLQRLFLIEGLLLGTAGCLAAAVPSTAIGLYIGIVGLDLSGLFPRDIPIPFGSVMYAVYSPVDALRALAAGLGAATLGSIVPARQASRLPITEAIGTAR